MINVLREYKGRKDVGAHEIMYMLGKGDHGPRGLMAKQLDHDCHSPTIFGEFPNTVVRGGDGLYDGVKTVTKKAAKKK